MMKKALFLFVLIFSLLFLSVGYATEISFDINQRALSHVTVHSSIPYNVVNQMTVSLEWLDSHSCWACFFRFFPFSEVIMEVWINDSGDILYCDCAQYTFGSETYQDGMMYYNAVKESAEALTVWESEFGPYELWDAEKNAAFFFTYHHIPGETQMLFSLGTVYYSYPSKEYISLEEALSLSDKILCDHLSLLKSDLTTLKKGSKFSENNGTPLYGIYYYSQNEDGQLSLQYSVRILAQSGLCLSAEKVKNPNNDDVYVDNDYWSDIYEFIQLDDGTFIRTKVKMI